jgi:hypothetical protein
MEEWMRDIRHAIPRELGAFIDFDDMEVTLSFTTSDELIHKTSCSLVTPMVKFDFIF